MPYRSESKLALSTNALMMQKTLFSSSNPLPVVGDLRARVTYTAISKPHTYQVSHVKAKEIICLDYLQGLCRNQHVKLDVTYMSSKTTLRGQNTVKILGGGAPSVFFLKKIIKSGTTTTKLQTTPLRSTKPVLLKVKKGC